MKDMMKLDVGRAGAGAGDNCRAGYLRVRVHIRVCIHTAQTAPPHK